MLSLSMYMYAIAKGGKNFISHPCRPALVSLDLSYNLLSNLEAVIRILAEVLSLRNLLLMGNPLSVSNVIYRYSFSK